ncbi:carbohydrate ABC transporter permease [Lederbergia citrea]|uniref:Carbohydrate ABC transporter permease n=1 Tax=Lederbergia citrea TaxID=2833581 RepID=A0A942Z3U7_9BACI|nr:carbohydrate ABC transporter permease [Lederbergia citrea]MBS4205194.1 carbohydrate ABC transporter permease [Lederbergia citrea]MBS4222944.1 carbohydrate ABC transporter permease [Lederbergia citrea]
MNTVAEKKTTYFENAKNRKRVLQIFVTTILILGSLLILSPVWWMISTSLKDMKEVMTYPPTLIPKEFHWGNYQRVLNAAPFYGYAANTLIITTIVVIGNVLSNTFIAYGFSKIRFKGRNTLFAIVLATMMIPGFVMLIPQYIIFSKLGWLNTWLPLTVPAFFGSAFFIFLLRQFFLTIPNELIEAAKIDGANHFYIWSRLMIPLTKPVIATVAIFSFNGAWNDFLGPLLYINDQALYTLQLGLQVFKGQSNTQWNLLMGGSLMVLLPVIILFFLFQRYFIEGMNITAGTKG